MVMCKVTKATYSDEASKILEEEFGAKGSDMQQQNMSQFVESAADLRVEKQDSERTSELGESHSKVDGGHEYYK